MKSLNSVTVIAIAALLIVGGVGCKKTPKNVTNIPGSNAARVGDDPTGRGPLPGGINPGQIPPGTGTPTGTDLPGTGTPIDPTTAATQTTRPPEGTDNREILAAETVYFEYDRSSVKSSEVPKVQRVATYLKNQPSTYLRVEGNCDERGTEEYNRSLGERRALAVRELLIASGIAPERVTTVTFGEDKPSDPGHDETAWSKNRRGDFVVVTPTGNQPLQ